MPLTKQTPMKTFIDDFIKSDDDRFTGKSKRKRIEMATAAYYAKQNEEFPNIEDCEIIFEDEIQDEPQKTVKVYKLFATKASHPGKLFATQINKNEDFPMGKWTNAKNIPRKGSEGSEGATVTKSASFADRPGIHAGTLPYAPQMLNKQGKVQAHHVFAEVHLPADKDWQTEADKRKAGGQRWADIKDEIPVGGHYKFNTGKDRGSQWYVGGSVKPVRVLDDDEVADILKKHGVTPPEREGGDVGIHNQFKQQNEESIESYSIEELQEFLDEETLDEISRNALGSYINKAAGEVAVNAASMPVFSHKNTVNTLQQANIKRTAGIAKAVKKLAEPGKPNKTGDYIHNAVKDMDIKAYRATGEKDDDKFDALDRGIENRKAGIARAVDKEKIVKSGNALFDRAQPIAATRKRNAAKNEEVEDLDESGEKKSKHVADVINTIKGSDQPTKEKHLAYLKSIMDPNDYAHIERLLKTEDMNMDNEEIEEGVVIPFVSKKSKADKADRDAKDKAGTEFVRNYVKKNLPSITMKPKHESFFDAIQSDRLSEAKESLEDILAEKVVAKLLELKEAVAKGRGASVSPYHDSYRQALEAAYAHAASKGFDVHEEDQDSSHVDPRPHKDETKRLHFRLLKDGKEHKKQLHVQVYNRGVDAPYPNYELNHYIA